MLFDLQKTKLTELRHHTSDHQSLTAQARLFMCYVATHPEKLDESRADQWRKVCYALVNPVCHRIANMDEYRTASRLHLTLPLPALSVPSLYGFSLDTDGKRYEAPTTASCRATLCYDGSIMHAYISTYTAVAFLPQHREKNSAVNPYPNPNPNRNPNRNSSTTLTSISTLTLTLARTLTQRQPQP